jgi:hypothetical protein
LQKGRTGYLLSQSILKSTASVEDSQGAKGLRDTMVALFERAVDKGLQHILVFEDDAKIVLEKYWFHDTMEKATAQLPENYHIFYLGGQPTGGYSHQSAPNLMPAIKYYATHAWGISLQGMKEILSRGMNFPIDNWIVDEIQPLGHCYAVHPILATQRPGFSDIGHAEIAWDPFIVQKHYQKMSELQNKRW